MSLKILILDTYYPDAIKAIPFDANSTYEVELRKVLDYGFGTADFYSHNLKALGHEAIDVIANHEHLQAMWVKERDVHGDTLLAQIESAQPSVLFLQDLGIKLPPVGYRYDIPVAGQCSCPWPGDAKIQRCDVVFTSFPHYVKRIEALGVRAIYLPLAFEPRMLEGALTGTCEECSHPLHPTSECPGTYTLGSEADGYDEYNCECKETRDLDISFVGGVGRNSHWLSGTDTLEIVAERFKERFHWYGYGLDNLPANSALRACYRGPAWGRAMYDIYRRSKIVVNRHGEVAQGYANNLRMYEATGCGALLLTEQSQNLQDLFTDDEAFGYATPEWAIEMILYFLSHDDERMAMAKAGEQRTLRDHTYAQRMKVVSDVLQEMLVSA